MPLQNKYQRVLDGLFDKYLMTEKSKQMSFLPSPQLLLNSSKYTMQDTSPAFMEMPILYVNLGVSQLSYFNHKVEGQARAQILCHGHGCLSPASYILLFSLLCSYHTYHLGIHKIYQHHQHVTFPLARILSTM
jgi:hypothetical protein